MKFLTNSFLTNVLLGIVLNALLLFSSGCVSSRLVDVWHDPSFHPSTLNKILVVSVRKDATKRRIWEDAFVIELKKKGIEGQPSYLLFPDNTPDTSMVLATSKENGFDGLLIIHRLPTETTREYIQGYTSVERDQNYNPYYRPYWPRYWTLYREIEHPGYIDSESVAISTIDVTTTGPNGRLIWSATSRTPDPDSATDVQEGIASLVVSELTSKKIINNTKK